MRQLSGQKQSQTHSHFKLVCGLTFAPSSLEATPLMQKFQHSINPVGSCSFAIKVGKNSSRPNKAQTYNRILPLLCL